jgi:hypothetical protein
VLHIIQDIELPPELPVTFSERKNTYSGMTSIKIESLNIYPESQEKTVSESAVGRNDDIE